MYKESAHARSPYMCVLAGHETVGDVAELVLLAAGQVLPLPNDFTYEAGAVLGCNFGTAWSVVRKAMDNAGGTLAIWGLGTLGLMPSWSRTHWGFAQLGLISRRTVES